MKKNKTINNKLIITKNLLLKYPNLISELN